MRLLRTDKQGQVRTVTAANAEFEKLTIPLLPNSLVDGLSKNQVQRFHLQIDCNERHQIFTHNRSTEKHHQELLRADTSELRPNPKQPKAKPRTHRTTRLAPADAHERPSDGE